MRAVLHVCLAAVATAAFGVPASAANPAKDGSALGAIINDAIRAGGPLLTPAERAVVNAKCGYVPGEWDGFDFSASNGVFQCTNGKKVDDPEMRALLKIAQPRIGARISAVMASAEVQEAIRHVASEAARRALANLGRGPD